MTTVSVDKASEIATDRLHDEMFEGEGEPEVNHITLEDFLDAPIDYLLADREQDALNESVYEALCDAMCRLESAEMLGMDYSTSCAIRTTRSLAMLGKAVVEAAQSNGIKAKCDKLVKE